MRSFAGSLTPTHGVLCRSTGARRIICDTRLMPVTLCTHDEQTSTGNAVVICRDILQQSSRP